MINAQYDNIIMICMLYSIGMDTDRCLDLAWENYLFKKSGDKTQL